MFVTLSTYFYVGVRMLNHSHKDVVYTNADERRLIAMHLCGFSNQKILKSITNEVVVW